MMAYRNQYLAAFLGGLGPADESVNLFHSKRRQNTEKVCVETREEEETRWCERNSLRLEVAARLLQSLRESGASRVLDQLLLARLPLALALISLLLSSTWYLLEVYILVVVHLPVAKNRRLFFFLFYKPEIAPQRRSERGAGWSQRRGCRTTLGGRASRSRARVSTADSI